MTLVVLGPPPASTPQHDRCMSLLRILRDTFRISRVLCPTSNSAWVLPAVPVPVASSCTLFELRRAAELTGGGLTVCLPYTSKAECTVASGLVSHGYQVLKVPV